MQINQYQFQSEVSAEIINGSSAEKVRERLTKDWRTYSHLAGENPSLKQFKSEVLQAVTAIDKDITRAKKMGPLAEAELTLWRKEVDLAGRIVADLSALAPTCKDDLSDIKEALGPINRKLDRENLQEGDLLLGGKYAQEIEDLYGIKEEEPAVDAESQP